MVQRPITKKFKVDDMVVHKYYNIDTKKSILEHSYYLITKVGKFGYMYRTVGHKDNPTWVHCATIDFYYKKVSELVKSIVMLAKE